MPRLSSANESLPPSGAAALRRLGDDLATARKRRRQSLKAWAERLQVSIPTLMRMEKGDPAVSMGVYATALWMIGLQEALAGAADPAKDLRALEAEVLEARMRYQRRGDADIDVLAQYTDGPNPGGSARAGGRDQPV